MKRVWQLFFAWLLIGVGCLVVLAGPVITASLSGYQTTPTVSCEWGGFRLEFEGPSASEVAVRSIPILVMGVSLIFTGIFFRQRRLGNS